MSILDHSLLCKSHEFVGNLRANFITGGIGFKSTQQLGCASNVESEHLTLLIIADVVEDGYDPACALSYHTRSKWYSSLQSFAIRNTRCRSFKCSMRVSAPDMS